MIRQAARARRAARRSVHARPVLLLAALAAGLGTLSCEPVEPLEPLVVTDTVRRFGSASDYLSHQGIVKPVIATRIGEPTELDVGRLPASKLLFATTIPGTNPEGAPETVSCEVHLDALGREDEPLACFELTVGEKRWHETEVSIPPVEASKLTLHCATEEQHPWAFWTHAVAVPHHSRRPAPLIVLLSFDTLRADHVTGFGATVDITPNLARLGDEGVRFSNATAEGTWTVPSHYALFYSRHYGFPTDTKPLVPLAQSLADKGFATIGLTGGGFVGKYWKFELGFDYYREYPSGEDKLETVFADGLAWIDKLRNAPTFLFLHSYAVHEPPQEEKEWVEEHGYFTPFQPTPQQYQSIAGTYEGLVRDADAAFGDFMQELRKIAERRPVLLVAFSDHGQAFGEHDNYGHGYDTGTLYDEVVRVPLIAWGPRVVRSGRTVERPVSLADVAPTILASVGVPSPPSMVGDRLWPLWAGSYPSEGQPYVPPDTPGVVSSSQQGWSLRSDTHKLIVAPDAEGKRYELYSLTDDPEEQNDLSGSEPARVESMAQQLRERLVARGVPVAGSDLPTCTMCNANDGKTFWAESLSGNAVKGARPPTSLGEEDRKRLAELGYGVE